MTNQLHRLVIGIGSNAENSGYQIEEAIKWCMTFFDSVKVSSVYTTKPYGIKARSIGLDYSNAVVVAATCSTCEEIVLALKDYELKHGRDDNSRLSGIVTIDLDLVMYDNAVLRPTEIEREYFSKGYRELLSETN